MNMNNDYLFGMAKQLVRRFSFAETVDILNGVDIPIGSPSEAAKAIISESKPENKILVGVFRFRRAEAVSIVALLLLVYFTFFSYIGAFTNIIIKQTIFAAAFPILLWTFIGGRDLARFSALNSKLFERRNGYEVLNVLLFLIPILVLAASFGVLSGAIKFEDVSLVGPAFRAGVTILAYASAAIAVFWCICSVRKSVLYFCGCVHAIGTIWFCITFVMAQAYLIEPVEAQRQLFMCLIPYMAAVVAAIVFAFYIRSLVKKGSVALADGDVKNR